MYMGLKDRRRQKEQDEYRAGQDSIANAQRKRQLDNADRTYEADQEQRGITNAHNNRVLTNDEKKIQRARAKQRLNALQLSIADKFTDANGEIDYRRALNSGPGFDTINEICRTNKDILAGLQNRNPDVVGVQGLEYIDSTSGDHTSKQLVMMLKMKDGSVKPMSSTGGMDDQVVSLGAKDIMQFALSPIGADDVDQVITALRDKALAAQGHNSVDEYNNDRVNSLTDSLKPAQAETTQTKTVQPAVTTETAQTETAQPAVTTETTQPAVTTGLGENTVTEPPAVANISPQVGGRSMHEDPSPQEIAAGRVITHFIDNVDPKKYPNKSRLEKLNYDGAIKKALVDTLGISYAEASQYLDGYEQSSGTTKTFFTDDSTGDGLADQVPLSLGEKIGEGANTAATFIGGALDTVGNAGSRMFNTGINKTTALGQDIRAGYTGTPSAANWDDTLAPTGDQKDQAASLETKQDNYHMQQERADYFNQQPGQKQTRQEQAAAAAEIAEQQISNTKPTQVEIEAAKKRVNTKPAKQRKISPGLLATRAVDMLILKEAGHDVSTKEITRYQLTGRANPVELPTLKTKTVNFNGTVWEVRPKPDGSTSYHALGQTDASKTSAAASTKADRAAVEKYNEKAWKGIYSTALGKGSVNVDGTGSDNVGSFMTRDEFDDYMQFMLTTNKKQIKDLYKLELTPGQPLGDDQVHMLSVLGQHLAQQVNASRGESGDKGTNYIGDFGRLVRAAAPETGVYVTNGTDGYETVDDWVAGHLSRNPNTSPVQARAAAREQLAKKQELNVQ